MQVWETFATCITGKVESGKKYYELLRVWEAKCGAGQSEEHREKRRKRRTRLQSGRRVLIAIMAKWEFVLENSGQIVVGLSSELNSCQLLDR